MRVRDEVRMVKNCYQSLYDSSIAYGIKKALVAEQRKLDQKDYISQLDREVRELEYKCEQVEDYIVKTQRDYETESSQANEDHGAVRIQMRETIAKLKFEIDKVLSLKINIW